MIRFRRLFTSFILPALIACLTGCGSGDSPAPQSPTDTGQIGVIRIDTGGSEIQDEPKKPATIQIWNSNSFLGDSKLIPADDPDRKADETYAGTIEIRGQSSQSFPKKCFGFEIRESAGSSEGRSVSLLGLPEESDWVLYGPYDDKALLRNWLTYRTANLLGRYAPRTRFVELFIDEPGDGTTEITYAGLYLLVEKIKRDRNRVAIDKLQKSDTSEPAVTGGYLLKIDKQGGNETVFTTDAGTTTELIYPKPDDLASEQLDWIRAYLNTAEAALKNDDSFSSRKYLEYWDLDSFVDFFLVTEFAKNVDGFRISSYYYKPRNGKLTAGPLWDFNISFGNADYYDGASTLGWQIDNTPGNDMCPPFWWNRFREDTLFRQKLAAKWRTARSGVLDEAEISASLDEAVAALGPAIDRNFAKWDILNSYVWPNAVYLGSYDKELAYMKKWISGRLEWIDSALEKY